MISLEDAVSTIEKSLILRSENHIETSPAIGAERGDVINILRDDAVNTLAGFVYRRFHSRDTKVVPQTNKANIIRFVRDHFSESCQISVTSVDTVKLLSFNRSPGFVHIFGDSRWLPDPPIIYRFYLTAVDAVERIQQFVKLVDFYNRRGFTFQAKTSLNPSVIRTDDTVFYFAFLHEFREAYLTFVDVSFGEEWKEDLLPLSLFTDPVTCAVAMAIENNSQGVGRLSFGLERASLCAEYIILMHRKGADPDFERLLKAWDYIKPDSMK